MADKQAAARKLAAVHYQIEPGITHIFTIREKPESEALPGTPIKLLEVNGFTVPAGILPLHFGPAPASGVPYSSIIVEVTPDEFERIKTQELQLPEGWVLGEELPRPPQADGNE